MLPSVFFQGGLCPFGGMDNLFGWHIRDVVAPKHFIEVRESHLSDIVISAAVHLLIKL